MKEAVCIIMDVGERKQMVVSDYVIYLKNRKYIFLVGPKGISL